MQDSIIGQIFQYVNLYFNNFLSRSVTLCIHTKFSIIQKYFLLIIFVGLFILLKG